MKICFRLILTIISTSIPIGSVQYVFAQTLPYPLSPVITKLTWAPSSTIIRKATGSDNWPITWAADDNLYTVYGDGWGFAPKAPRKLSLGFAKVEGTPPNFSGTNIHSPDEHYGDGSSGKKASGILMVDNTLYMWARNANGNGEQSQLAFSSDCGKTWRWCTWKFDEFGYCTFINFLNNYEGARDNYVYTVTHDHPSAYKRADRFILIRVPKDQIINQASYEFFTHMDDEGNPVWTSDIAQRGAVFTDTDRCHRSGISYNIALKRYIWWQAKYPKNVDGRYAGMFGVFDAPEPWGPWTTIYYTENWDVGAGETGSFPPKWMSKDGKNMYLVFSGNDSFSVRKASLTLSNPAETTSHETFEWIPSSPETQGMSARKLEEMQLVLAKRGSKALLVIRNDRIVLEWYAKGYYKTTKYGMASLAKALVGGMSLLVALNDGLMGIDNLASKYIPQWKNDPLKSKITIRMLATHTSGIEDAKQENLPNHKLTGWKGQFWKHDPDPFSVARDQAPVIFPPGTQYAYSNPGYAMLGYAITASLKGSSQSDIYTLLKERIMDRIGVSSNEWSISYGNNSYNLNGMKVYAVWGGGEYTARAVARAGRLMLRKGNWEGRQLVNSTLVDKIISYTDTPLPDRSKGDPKPGSGLCWYTNFDRVWPSLPRDAFVGAGAGHQVLLVVPSLNLIVVRFGRSLDKDIWGLFKEYTLDPIIGKRGEDSFWAAIEKCIFEPIMRTIEK